MAPNGSVDPGSPAIVWEHESRLLTDRFILWEFFKVSGLSAASVPVLVLLVGWFTLGETVVLPWRVPVVAFGAMFVLMCLASLVMGNKQRAVFELSELGVVSRAGTRQRRINRFAFLAGALAGNATAAGAGALAIGGEDRAIPWEALRSVKVYPTQRVVVLKDSWHVVLRLYCPPDNFQQMVTYVQRRTREAGEARLAEQAAAGETTRRPVWHRLAAAVGALALTMGAQIWPWTDYDLAVRAGVVGGVLLIVAATFEGPPRRILGLLGGAGVAWHAGGLILSALDPVEGLFGTSPAAVLDTPLLVVSGVSTAGLIALAVWRVSGRAWGTDRGRSEE